nr:tRNA lysidine(34) synthetase TilS [Thiopseudomonas sp.]
HWQSWQTLRDAKSAAKPLWRLQQGALLRSQNTLYWLPEEYLDEPPVLNLTIGCAGRYQLANNGYLTVSGELHAPLQISYRQGAERLLIAGRGHRDLKRLLQEERIPAFLRGRLPLVFQQGQLLAIANLTHLNHAALGSVTIDWQLIAENQLDSKKMRV